VDPKTVIDGDTFYVSVRLLGVDAPEEPDRLRRPRSRIDPPRRESGTTLSARSSGRTGVSSTLAGTRLLGIRSLPTYSSSLISRRQAASCGPEQIILYHTAFTDCASWIAGRVFPPRDFNPIGVHMPIADIFEDCKRLLCLLESLLFVSRFDVYNSLQH
jgi:hypothetical protein